MDSVAEEVKVPKRICHKCDQPIPVKRIAANPRAIYCVPCLNDMGDVPLMRRFDEAVGDDQAQTMFLSGDKRMEAAVHKVQTTTVPSMREVTVMDSLESKCCGVDHS